MESKTGATVSYIGGILGIIVSVILIIGVVFLTVVLSLEEPAAGVFFGAVFIVLSLLYLVCNIFFIISASWMKKQETVVRGGIVAVVLGSLIFNIFWIIGGIIALVDSEKK
jgi:hypothetical protein